ncbi:hypothetical protein CXG81DRAFT_109, partial [Caulochytrium protostelioides]
ARILLVGAGGIGCELLKNLVLSGFDRITVLDLDSIDVSNLNRQFLFRKEHVKQAKAVVARRSALQFNPAVTIDAVQADIFDRRYDLAFFRQFDLVLNALDNAAARSHVNLMCLAADRPLIESGTAGYMGQMSVHWRGHTPCYDCDVRTAQKTFPICTIRSTPTLPIHCIVWAKSFLLPQLFGIIDDAADDAALQTEATADNQDEVQRLRAETAAMHALRRDTDVPDFPDRVWRKIFVADVAALGALDSLWKDRAPPRVLDADALLADAAAPRDPASLAWNNQVWTPAEAVLAFRTSLRRLGARYAQGRAAAADFAIEFDKDDEDTLDFVAACAYLRSLVYGIPVQSRFKVKEDAGNIIPAIATTNAVVAGLIVLAAFRLLATPRDAVTRETTKGAFILHNNPARAIQSSRAIPPNPACVLCHSAYATLAMDAATTFRDVVAVCQRPRAQHGVGLRGTLEIEEAGRLLYDVDFDDALDKTLVEMNVAPGQMLAVTNVIDED